MLRDKKERSLEADQCSLAPLPCSNSSLNYLYKLVRSDLTPSCREGSRNYPRKINRKYSSNPRKKI